MNKQLLYYFSLFLSYNLLAMEEENQIIINKSDNQPQWHETTQNILNAIEEKNNQLSEVYNTRLRLSEESKLNNPKKIKDIHSKLQQNLAREIQIVSPDFIEDIFSSSSVINLNQKRQEISINKSEFLCIMNSFRKLWNQISEQTKQLLINKFFPLKYFCHDDLGNYSSFAQACISSKIIIPTEINKLLDTEYAEKKKNEDTYIKQRQTTCNDISSLTRQIALLQIQLKKKENECKLIDQEINQNTHDQETILKKACILLTTRVGLQYMVEKTMQEIEDKCKQKENEINIFKKQIEQYKNPQYRADLEKQTEIINLEEQLKEKTEEKAKIQTELTKYKSRSQGSTWSDLLKWNSTQHKGMQEWLDHWNK